jgi:NADH dehydrogenase
MPPAAKTVVILGGGFAGVYAARHLQGRLPPGWEIILFSQENHFIFTPLLGDVVGSSINPTHTVWPIRQMVRGVTCRTATVTAIHLPDRLIHYQTANGAMATQAFGHLVLACGSMVNLDIIPGLAAHAWPLKTMGDALMLRNHVIGQMEKAEVESDPAAKKRLLAVAVIGAGFSGVEVTGEIADLMLGSRRYYSTIKESDIQVTLLEGRDRILGELPESLSQFAFHKMRRRGIDIRLKALAQAVTETGVRLKDGSAIDCGTVVCTIGTSPNPLIKALGLPMEWGRIKAGPDFRVAGQEHVWALGDCAYVIDAKTNAPCAPTAQVAVRQATRLADNLVNVIDGQPTRPFAFQPLGMLASIGNHKAVGTVFGMRVSGFLAWFLWRGVYLGKMPTLARKVQIAFDWAWQLFFPRDLVQINLEQTRRLQSAHFEPGQFVFHKGDAGDRFYVIQRGKAGVYLDENGPPTLFLGPGDHFGEGSLLRAGTRSASVRAEEPLDVLTVGAVSFLQLTKHLEVLRTALERSAQGARSSAELLKIAQGHPRLNALTAGAVMSKPVATLPVGLTFRAALDAGRAAHKGAYPVVDADGRMVGIVTRTDFYNALQKLLPDASPLAEVMHKPVITVRESETLTAALLVFLREPIKRVVVVADEDATRPVGMLTAFDIVQVLGETPVVGLVATIA